MSSSAGTPRDGKEKKGVLSRMKNVFHRKEKGTRKVGRGGTSPVRAPVAPLMSQPPAPQPRTAPEYEGVTRIPRIQIHEERAKKLGARFGLEIKPNEWHRSEGDVLRVDKPVRMRIHRECHRCQARFGGGNVCTKCQHTRCKKCTRYPDNMTEADRQANRDKREALRQKHKDRAPIIPSYDFAPEIILKRPSKTGKQDVVYKGRARVRVRRYCHVCETLISSHANQARVCDQCGHKRCGDCPRSPDDRKKYPYGYPNDEPGTDFKGVFACHECKKKFRPDAEDGTPCARCNHAKCSQCRRVRPKKVEPEPDPDVLESLRQRMAELQVVQS